MPCIVYTKEEIARMDREKYREEINNLGRMLCEVIRGYEAVCCGVEEQDKPCFSEELIQWWKAHKARDQKRLEYEELLRKAEQRLSRATAERNIAGVDVAKWKKKLKEMKG